MRIVVDDIGEGEMVWHPWRDDAIPKLGNTWRSSE
jgi:hypothetical protein